MMKDVIIGLIVLISLFVYALLGDVDSDMWSSFYNLTTDILVIFLVNVFLKRYKTKAAKFIFSIILGFFIYGAVLDLISIAAPKLFSRLNESVECALLTASVVLVLLITYLYERLVKR